MDLMAVAGQMPAYLTMTLGRAAAELAGPTRSRS
jgi:hypothetical protein